MTARITWNGPAVTAKVRAAAERAVRDGAEHVLEQANRTVPIEEGTLLRSGTVSASGTRATVSYDTPYARRQHEDLSLRHDAGRRAKWLERTMRERAVPVRDLIATRIGAALR